MTINYETGILTLGYGADRYIDMAIGLAQSLMLNSPSYPRAIVTDRRQDELSQYFDIIIPYKSEYGKNLEQKLHLDLYTPFQRTMFIDSDSLVVRSLDFAFDMFFGHAVTTTESRKVSYGYTDPNFEINVDKVLEYFDIDFIPRFNGGIYYLERNSTCTKVFKKAREILPIFQDLGIREFRNCGPNEEVLIGISMRLNNMETVSDNGYIMRTPIGLTGKIEIDVLKNYSRFNKQGTTVSPAIIHYCGKWVLHPTYAREVFKLKYAINRKGKHWLPINLLLPLIYLRAQLGFSIFKFVKLRPLAKALSGYYN